MDGLPYQVRLQFVLDETRKVDPKDVASRSFKVLVDIEGQLIITIDDKLFFRENGILVLEFGLRMMHWLHGLRNRNLGDFVYVPMDHPEAILSFTLEGIGMWRVDSPWAEHTERIIVPENVLVDGVHEYLTNLQRELRLTYGLEMRDFVAN